MRIRFWGTRGSLPAPLNAPEVRSKVTYALERAMQAGITASDDLDAFVDSLPFWARGTYGTNTPCMQVATGGDEYVICDAGSGLRDFANHLMRTAGPGPHTFHIFLSHLHWDHIHGFPFFTPAYIKGNRIVFHSGHGKAYEALSRQQSAPFFPVDFSDLGAEIRFETMVPGKEYAVAGLAVRMHEQRHPGGSFGYRLQSGDKSVVYATDSEHKDCEEESSRAFAEFAEGTDLLVFDAQYTYADACSIKEDWGHSNNIIGVELAHRAGARRLALFHLEPTMNDRDLDKTLKDTGRYAALFDENPAPEVLMASDGLVVDL